MQGRHADQTSGRSAARLARTLSLGRPNLSSASGSLAAVPGRGPRHAACSTGCARSRHVRPVPATIAGCPPNARREHRAHAACVRQPRTYHATEAPDSPPRPEFLGTVGARSSGLFAGRGVDAGQSPSAPCPLLSEQHALDACPIWAGARLRGTRSAVEACATPRHTVTRLPTSSSLCPLQLPDHAVPPLRQCDRGNQPGDRMLANYIVE